MDIVSVVRYGGDIFLTLALGVATVLVWRRGRGAALRRGKRNIVEDDERI